MGMRLDGGTTEQDIFDNFEWLRDHHISDLMVEMPFQSSFLPPHRPYVDSLQLDQIAAIASQCHQHKVNLHIGLLTQNQTELFPQNRIDSPDLWFQQLELMTHHILNACGPYPPRRVLFGENLVVAESYASKWREVFEHLRDRWKVLISYSSHSDRSSAEPLWSISDEIAISYSAATDDDALPFCREQNLHIAQLAKQQQKPVFISRSNLLGRHPEQLFDYRLRYWGEDVMVSGICINTIYSRVSPLDSSSYYGIKDQADLLQKLDDYITTSKQRP